MTNATIMDHNTANALIERYFAAETTLAEEAALRDYFARGAVHEALEPYRPLFDWMALEQQLAPAADFDERLAARIPELQEPVRRMPLRASYTYMSRAAAVLLLVAAAWWLLRPSLPEAPQPIAAETSTIDWSKYEPETVEEAYDITRKALLQTSKVMNDGASQAAAGMKRGLGRE